MRLRNIIFFAVMVPMGLLCVSTYMLEEIRNAVAEYIAEVLFIPIGLVMFFCFGATVGLLLALLFVPNAALELLDEPDRPETLGVAGAVVVRGFCLAALMVFFLAASIVIDVAYG